MQIFKPSKTKKSNNNYFKKMEVWGFFFQKYLMSFLEHTMRFMTKWYRFPDKYEYINLLKQ